MEYDRWKKTLETKEKLNFLKNSVTQTNPKTRIIDYRFLTKQIIIFWGNYLFLPWTTKKCVMPPWTTNSTKIEHSTTKYSHFPPFRQSKGLKQTINGSRDHHTPFYLHFLPLFPPWTTTIFLFSPMNYHNLPTCPHVKRHMTRWLFLLTPLTDGRGENSCLW